MSLKTTIKAGFRKLGYEIRKIDNGPPRRGVDPFADIKRLVTPINPVIFDVGANVGQSVEQFRSYLEQPIIHSFEPGKDTFQELKNNYVNVPDLHLNNFALGSREGTHSFFENTAGSPMNSLLEFGTECMGEFKAEQQVNVSTIDKYCNERKVDRVDVLKIDTQGFDLEVIKGAQGMINNRSIYLIYMEIIFCDMYKGLPRLDEIYAFIADNGFELVTFYPFYYWGEKASWTEALFMHPEYREPYPDFADTSKKAHHEPKESSPGTS